MSRIEVLAAAVLFSTGGAMIKAAGSMTGWQVASYRSGVAALALLIFLRESRTGFRPATWLVGAGYAATLILFVQSTKLTTAANAIFLQSTAPLYLILLGPLVLKEPVRRRDLGFLAALALGLSLFFVGAEAPQATAPDPVRGNLLGIASGVAWAVTVTGLRWLGREPHRGSNGGALAAVASGNVLAFALCLPWAAAGPGGRVADWLVIAYLGIFQIGLAYVFMTRGLRKVRALEAALLLSVEPVLNPLWAWIVHGERPSRWALAGGAVIVAATVANGLVAARAERGGAPSARGPRPE